jgi:hypothetical protein
VLAALPRLGREAGLTTNRLAKPVASPSPPRKSAGSRSPGVYSLPKRARYSPRGSRDPAKRANEQVPRSPSSTGRLIDGTMPPTRAPPDHAVSEAGRWAVENGEHEPHRQAPIESEHSPRRATDGRARGSRSLLR